MFKKGEIVQYKSTYNRHLMTVLIEEDQENEQWFKGKIIATTARSAYEVGEVYHFQSDLFELKVIGSLKVAETFDWINEELNKPKFNPGDLVVLNNDEFVLFIVGPPLIRTNKDNHIFKATCLKSSYSNYIIGSTYPLLNEKNFDLAHGTLQFKLKEIK